MALVFCLNLSCSLGCSRSKDSPRQAFCHPWVAGEVTYCLWFCHTRVWNPASAGQRAALQEVKKDSVFFCREFRWEWKWHFPLCFHSCLGKENFERQSCCSLSLERPFLQQEGGPVQQPQAEHCCCDGMHCSAFKGKSPCVNVVV